MHSVLLAIYFIDAGPGPSLIFHNNTVAIYACSVCTMLGPSPGFAYVRVQSSHQIWLCHLCVFISIGPRNHREGKGRGETSRMSLTSTCCYVQASFLGMETKILFSLLWYIHSYLIKNFKV
jgi:hypothetical protein